MLLRSCPAKGRGRGKLYPKAVQFLGLRSEILKEALARSRAKKPTLLATSPLRDDFR
jgi:hypothetical protein